MTVLPIIGSFVRHQRLLLFFGFLLAFFSGFGQTFLISLYVPRLAVDFSLSNAAISGLFGAATLASALTLPWVGPYVDIWPLRRYAMGVIAGLATALLLLSAAVHPAMVLVGLWGMRLCGQGLMSHTSMAAISRAFEAKRGRAIGLAILGHPAGEAVLPLMVAAAIAALGWRETLQLSAAVLLLLLIPSVVWLLRPAPPAVAFPHRAGDPMGENPRPPARVGAFLRGQSFWRLIPPLFLWGFIYTAVFFFQLSLGATRGWAPAWVAGSLAAFAVASALAMMGAGSIADRWSARRTYAFFPLPAIIGLLLLAFGRHPLIYPAALFCMGLSNGAGSTLFNMVLAEVYGVGVIGTVRSLFATVLVVSTAVGPFVCGALLDAGAGYDILLLGAAIVTAGGALWSSGIRKVASVP